MTSEELVRKSALVLSASLLTILLSVPGGAQTETLLYNFKGTTDGGRPESDLLADKSGNLYGTTYLGGDVVLCGGCGTVFELTPPVAGGHWTETVLYSFHGGIDGGFPYTGLAMDALGNLYGAASAGGTSGLGFIFKLSPPNVQGAEWTETILYNFGPGEIPSSDPILDTQGNLYGEAGNNVYQITQPAGTHTLLFSFNDILAEGGYPVGGLSFDRDGNLYGTTNYGGGASQNCNGWGCGTVFKLVKPAGGISAWKERVLYRFTGTGDGAYPSSGVAIHGNKLYGTTSYGGNALGDGTVFELVPPQSQGGAWTENVILTMDRYATGFRPFAGVIFGSNGNLYSTTYFSSASSGGEVFQLAPPTQQGGTWTQTILHNFNCDTKDGCYTKTNLVFDKGTGLYGTTSDGGARAGVAFVVKP